MPTEKQNFYTPGDLLCPIRGTPMERHEKKLEVKAEEAQQRKDIRDKGNIVQDRLNEIYYMEDINAEN